MTELRRFLSDPDATPFERDLLESWSSEQPSAGARARALAIGGVAVVTLVGAAAAGTTAAAAGAGATTAAGAAPKVAIGVAAILKWAAVGALVAGAAVATVALVREPAVDPRAPAPAAQSTASTTRGASPSIARATAPSPVEPPTISPADLPAAAPVPSADAPTTRTTTSSAASSSGLAPSPGLADEIALFDRARAALDAGEADRALGLLDSYESRFRTGSFIQEAEVLRVQALVRKGDRERASRVGQRFLAAHPTSPHAARIRAILAPSNP